MNRGIAVIGSLNMDFVITVDTLPAPGETVLGRDFVMIPGQAPIPRAREEYPQ